MMACVQLVPALGAYAFACSVALLIVVFPGGIGAREVLLVAALHPVLSSGAALAIALAARLVATVSDLTWGGIGLALTRLTRASASPATGIRPRGGAHRKSIGALSPTSTTAGATAASDDTVLVRHSTAPDGS